MARPKSTTPKTKDIVIKNPKPEIHEICDWIIQKGWAKTKQEAISYALHEVKMRYR